VISRVRPSFWRAYTALDPRVEEAARRSYGLFVDDPGHPSLRFKKLAGHDRIWSVRINDSFRALAETLTLGRAEVVKTKASPLSTMPEGLLLAFPPEQVRDLIAYLMNPSQVPLPAQ